MIYVYDAVIIAIFLAVLVLFLWLLRSRRSFLTALPISLIYAAVTSTLGSRLLLWFEDCHVREWMTEIYNSLSTYMMGIVIWPFLRWDKDFQLQDAYDSKLISVVHHSLSIIVIWLAYLFVLWLIIFLIKRFLPFGKKQMANEPELEADPEKET